MKQRHKILATSLISHGYQFQENVVVHINVDARVLRKEREYFWRSE